MPVRVPVTRLRGTGGQFARGGAGYAWQGLDVIKANINRRYEDLQRTRKQAAYTLARKIEAYMKANAPWQDQTGDARAQLKAVAIHEDNRQISTVWAGHNVNYGFWLEVMQGGKYAIVGPTMLQFQNEVGGELNEAESTESTLSRI